MADPEGVDALERIVAAGVALTASALARAGPGLELTLPQWRVLMVLAARPEPLSVSAVAAAIDVTLPATSRQLRRLEGRGLITLEPDPRDRRSIRVALTATGHELRASVIAFRRSRLTALVDDLEMTTAVETALVRVAAALDEPIRRG